MSGPVHAAARPAVSTGNKAGEVLQNSAFKPELVWQHGQASAWPPLEEIWMLSFRFLSKDQQCACVCVLVRVSKDASLQTPVPFFFFSPLRAKTEQPSQSSCSVARLLLSTARQKKRKKEKERWESSSYPVIL